MYDHIGDYFLMFPDDHYSLQFIGMYHFARMHEIEIRQNFAREIKLQAETMQADHNKELQTMVESSVEPIKKAETEIKQLKGLLGDVQKELKKWKIEKDDPPTRRRANKKKRKK